ncbi:LysR family transcriptional regulator [Rhodoplanes sp. Z2-YC6860]|uniref:LysR family transcriptional regulator n=1 Tax=Rhodoplanes sp. Z2-YC6860 TaxID=674703 RepID=UPI00078D3943|nr:LysR family transcriptional regulator [Rhodoplanes sp. Z2-YC6860]AMN43131.1 LysR family transcriptional regulator [Rhodoplanes sp. Z2-YC6860]
MRALNLDQLRAFAEVIRHGSFTAAAKALNLSQPAVTHQVQELERRFKVALVERIGKRAYLTQAGEALLEHTRHLLDESERTLVDMRKFDDGWLGRVRIGTSMTVLMYVLPPLLRQLKTRHPQLELTLKAGVTSGTLQMLKTGQLDLGLCAIPINDPAFTVTPLFDDELYAIFPTAQQDPTLKDLPRQATPAFMAKCPLILGTEHAALRRTIVEWLQKAGPAPKPIMEFDNVEAMKSMVAVGLGTSIVPGLSLGSGHVPTDNIRALPLNPRAKRRVGLVQLKGSRSTEGVRLVAAALKSLDVGKQVREAVNALKGG